MLFDRIVCDVPCSSDAAIRKIPQKWEKWSTQDGASLHVLQARILFKGLQLLKVGGRLSYSTCSLNPIEDEAVVSEILELCGGAIELVDVSGEMTALRRLPGLKSWKVRDKFRWADRPAGPGGGCDQNVGTMTMMMASTESDSQAQRPRGCQSCLPLV